MLDGMRRAAWISSFVIVAIDCLRISGMFSRTRSKMMIVS